jgi:hypothetical protein
MTLSHTLVNKIFNEKIHAGFEEDDKIKERMDK